MQQQQQQQGLLKIKSSVVLNPFVNPFAAPSSSPFSESHWLSTNTSSQWFPTFFFFFLPWIYPLHVYKTRSAPPQSHPSNSHGPTDNISEGRPCLPDHPFLSTSSLSVVPTTVHGCCKTVNLKMNLFSISFSSVYPIYSWVCFPGHYFCHLF